MLRHRQLKFDLERKFQKLLKAKLEGVGGGAKVLNVHGQLMQESGWPDLQVYSPHLPHGMMHWELKVKRNKLRPLQKEVIDELIARGTCAYVVRAVVYDLQFENTDETVAFIIENWQLHTGIEIMQAVRCAVIHTALDETFGEKE